MIRRRFGKLASGSTLALVIGLGFLLARSPEAVVAAGYGHALTPAETTWGTLHGSGIVLSRLGEQPFGLRRALAIGDRITVRSEIFEVTALEQIDGDQPSLGLGPHGRIQAVTARSEDTAETVRFLFAVEAAPRHPHPHTGPDGKVL